tara:strand:+ start:80 stop:745 length:666 start_codon:yes stop_codon:yes gene_type:complete
MTAWSYSSLKTFEQCPKKYYHLKVAKDVKDKGSSAMFYGNEVHKAAEQYMKEGTPIPPKFKFIGPTLRALEGIEGEKLCEIKLGVAKTDDGYKPSTFFGRDVWWRGIADLVIINGDTAHSIDYKTSKNARYADTKQLDAVAAALFIHHPQLKRIKSALAFVVSKEFIKKEHTADLTDSYFESFKPDLDRLAGAEESGVWNAISGPLCGYCPVTACEHNRKP